MGNKESLKIVAALPLPLPLPITSLTYPLNSLAPTLIFTSTRLAVLSLGSSYSHDIQYPTVTLSWPSYPPILYLLSPRSILVPRHLLIVPSFVSPSRSLCRKGNSEKCQPASRLDYLFRASQPTRLKLSTRSVSRNQSLLKLDQIRFPPPKQWHPAS